MPPYYAAMDILVLPSHREGLGLATLEAGAMRLPVVATNIPGCIDAVDDGVTGLLVPPYDSKALADVIDRYLNNSELRMRHGYAGRSRVLKKFSQTPIWEETLNSYIELFNSDGAAKTSNQRKALK
jgi:glycosyltransferase involved in cell wall biosynthesis